MERKHSALVTGATGFVGSHLADMLYDNGYNVRCTIRKNSALTWLKDKNYELIEAPLDNIEALKSAVQDVDYVFHVAGVIFANNEDEFMRGNRDAVENILKAAEEVNPGLKRFILISSQAAAGPSKSMEKAKCEDDDCSPITAYGRSKKAGEDVLLKFKGKIPYTIIRAPAIYGPRDPAILTIFKTVKMGFGTLIGMKPKLVSLIHVTDLVKGIIQAAESEKAVDQTYFISSEKFYSWDETMQYMKNAFGMKRLIKIKAPHFLVLAAAGFNQALNIFRKKPHVFNYEKGVDFIQMYWTCSVDKAKRDFGFKQNISLQEGIKDTADWYIKNNWL